MKVMKENLYPCPSCGFLVFEEPTGSYDICEICGWEDDDAQLKYPTMKVGANNGESLLDCQKEILKEIPPEIKEHNGVRRCSNWRPLNAKDLQTEDKIPTTGIEYFFSKPEESPPYYWKKNADDNKEIE